MPPRGRRQHLNSCRPPGLGGVAGRRGGCVDLFIQKLKTVGVGDLVSLVEYSFSAPSVMRLLLWGVEFVGRYAEEWREYLNGRLSAGARMRWPRLDVGVELNGVKLQISPAYLLLPYDGHHKKIWQTKAYTLLRLSEVPTHYHPHWYISQSFPQELRALAVNGYVWVANTRSFGKRNLALAEWLYWLDNARMPHIDLMLGRFIRRSPLDNVINTRRGTSGGWGQRKATIKIGPKNWSPRAEGLNYVNSHADVKSS